MSGEQNHCKQNLLTSDLTDAKSPLSEAKKHHDFRVTLCIHFVSTNAEFYC